MLLPSAVPKADSLETSWCNLLSFPQDFDRSYWGEALMPESSGLAWLSRPLDPVWESGDLLASSSPICDSHLPLGPTVPREQFEP